MVIITKKKLCDFAAIHSGTEDAIDNWYRETKRVIGGICKM